MLCPRRAIMTGKVRLTCESKDMLKRSCAEYNIAIACLMLGDAELAIEWLDRSDADCKLPMSDVLRKRLSARL